MGSIHQFAATPRRTAQKDDPATYIDAYLAEVEAGRDPGLVAFMEAVPDDLQDDVFRAIDKALANRDHDHVSEPVEDAVEIVVQQIAEEQDTDKKEDGRISVSLDEHRFLRWAFVLVPSEIRRHLLAELLVTLREMREASVITKAWTVIRCLGEGVAQHAPLSVPEENEVPFPDEVRRVATGGWISWRLCGAALLAGKLAGASWMLLSGLLLLMAAIGSLAYVTLKLREPHPERCVRLANAVMGGVVVILAVTLVYGIVTIGTLALAASLSAGWLATLALEAQVFVVALAACAVTVSGWVPEPWSPRRLLRI